MCQHEVHRILWHLHASFMLVPNEGWTASSRTRGTAADYCYLQTHLLQLSTGLLTCLWLAFNRMICQAFSEFVVGLGLIGCCLGGKKWLKRSSELHSVNYMGIVGRTFFF